jgi:hypothetical protein
VGVRGILNFYPVKDGSYTPLAIFINIIKLINSILYRILKKRFLLSDVYQTTGSASRINKLLAYTMGKNYLEIGVNYGFTFEGVKADHKLGVDPQKKFFTFSSGGHFKDNSDNFFKSNTRKFDLIFIDGLHEYKQVLRDIVNSLNSLNRDGIVLIDDVYPTDFNTAAKSWELLTAQEKHSLSKGYFSWQGDVYKAVFYIINEYKSLINFFTVNDNNHIQMVVKKKNYKTIFKIPSQDSLELYDNPKLINELKNGIPKSWNYCSMEELIIKFVKTID